MARELKALKGKQIKERAVRSTAYPSSPMSESPSKQNAEGPATPGFNKMNLGLEAFYLGDFTIDKANVIDIFKIFTTLFYPHFPVIDPVNTIPSIYFNCPIRFWTVIAIVTSRELKPGHVELFNGLRKPFEEQLRVEALMAPLPIPTVQALTYLMVWPLPVQRQFEDPSWLYSGIAINSALDMGLNRSEAIQPPKTRNVSLQSRVKTWLGCFLSSTTLAMMLGISPPVNLACDLNIIEQYVRHYPLPSELGFQVIVQQTLAKYTNALLDDSGGSANFSLVQVVINELDILQKRYPTDWTNRTDLALMTAKLHLYATSIIRMKSDTMSLNILIKLAFPVAVRVVYLCNQGLHFTSDEYPDLAPSALRRTLPKHYSRSLTLATLFLLRYFVLNAQATLDEREVARNHVAMAHAHFRGSATKFLDEWGQIACVFEALSRQAPVDMEAFRQFDIMAEPPHSAGASESARSEARAIGRQSSSGVSDEWNPFPGLDMSLLENFCGTFVASMFGVHFPPC
ncbi:hypothetical protein CC78DRAFT_584103 [Lojkania enalia]|uniref:Xylanolytic transcriptional activator regulatory domain-containing protein n=1 Tax=Lojkania enalia TaxID=147567 RepID=A0A9P4K353_9PLEO|nr:hypothetical protein CC78DRAFT_584103 [Didymosphaeria enalia]